MANTCATVTPHVGAGNIRPFIRWAIPDFEPWQQRPQKADNRAPPLNTPFDLVADVSRDVGPSTRSR